MSNKVKRDWSKLEAQARAQLERNARVIDESARGVAAGGGSTFRRESVSRAGKRVKFK
jgi:hypothetical protein